MKYVLLFFCSVLFVLFSCSSKEEAEENISSSSSSMPSSSSSCRPFFEPYEPEPYEPDPSVFDHCPAEDVAEYPIPEFIPWLSCESPPDGWVGLIYKLSVEELSFDKRGGVRCVAVNSGISIAKGEFGAGCRVEYDPYFVGNLFVRSVCPWLTVTKLDDQTLHVLVEPNETGEERNMYIEVSIINTGSGFKITQSAD